MNNITSMIKRTPRAKYVEGFTPTEARHYVIKHLIDMTDVIKEMTSELFDLAVPDKEVTRDQLMDMAMRNLQAIHRLNGKLGTMIWELQKM